MCNGYFLPNNHFLKHARVLEFHQKLNISIFVAPGIKQQNFGINHYFLVLTSRPMFPTVERLPGHALTLQY